MLHTETDSKCRLCQQFDEKTDHVISACPTLAKKQYIKNMTQLHFNICKKIGVNTGISTYQNQ